MQTVAGRPSLRADTSAALSSAVCAEGEKFKLSVRSAEGAGGGAEGHTAFFPLRLGCCGGRAGPVDGWKSLSRPSGPRVLRRTRLGQPGLVLREQTSSRCPTLGCVGSLSTAGDASGVGRGNMGTTGTFRSPVVGGPHTANLLPMQRLQVGSPAVAAGELAGVAPSLWGRSRLRVGSVPGSLEGRKAPMGPTGTRPRRAFLLGALLQRPVAPFSGPRGWPVWGLAAEVGPRALCCRTPHRRLCSAAPAPGLARPALASAEGPEGAGDVFLMAREAGA